MKLIVQPEDGPAPLVKAIKQATKSVELVIFRFDLADVEKALKAAVTRGVLVRTLIAHTAKGGEQRLRKLELRLLDAGVTVSRTADDLVRYHGKVMIVDRETLHVYGFNYTHLDIEKSRSFGVITKKRALVQEAGRLFDADATRQPFEPIFDDLVVSPENARERLARFLRRARRQLLIYDPKVADLQMIRLLRARAAAGVEVRIMGKLGKRGAGLQVAKFPGKRMHVRAIIRDGRRAFIGSQSLRRLELDDRREVGVIIRDPKIVKALARVFESDWELTKIAKKEAEKREAEVREAEEAEKEAAKKEAAKKETEKKEAEKERAEGSGLRAQG